MIEIIKMKLLLIIQALLLHHITGSHGFTLEFSEPKAPTQIIFPGGGIFFYWQAGAISYLREQNYPIHDRHVHFTGASAGALCATLTAADVDFETATSHALKLSRDAGIWDRKLGLYGIWGGIVDEWLDELLPEDDEIVLDAVNDKVSLLVTEVPSFKKKKLSQFYSKRDLIDANLASVHIPLFMDKNWTAEFRRAPHIDGSFLAELSDYHVGENSVILDWQSDPLLRDRSLGDSVTALSEEGIWDLLERGRKYAVKMEDDGLFDVLNH